MLRSAVVKPCPPTACPNKPDRDKKWCLLSADETKVLKCSPTKSGAEAHEKNVNYFKNATLRFRTAAVQLVLQRMPQRLRAAYLRDLLRNGSFKPVLVRYAGQLWRLR